MEERSLAPAYIVDAYQSLLCCGTENIPNVGMETPIPSFDEETLINLCDAAIGELSAHTHILYIVSPIVVVGDLHGNLHDLLRIWNSIEDPFSHRFLFLGDYVDRGGFQLEVITLLLALMIEYPNNIYLIRGNHEFADVNATYGFKDEVMEKYSEQLWNKFNSVFEYLPLTAVINEVYFCVHGGLSPQLMATSDLLSIPFPLKTEETSFVSDLVWSDPTHDCYEFLTSNRGKGVYFGPLAIHSFLVRNNFQKVIRAHESVKCGIKKFSEGKLVTVFSSSGYSSPDSKAGYLMINEKGKIYEFKLEAIDIPARSESNFKFVARTKKVKRVAIRSFLTADRGITLMSSQSFKSSSISLSNSRTTPLKGKRKILSQQIKCNIDTFMNSCCE